MSNVSEGSPETTQLSSVRDMRLRLLRASGYSEEMARERADRYLTERNYIKLDLESDISDDESSRDKSSFTDTRKRFRPDNFSRDETNETPEEMDDTVDEDTTQRRKEKRSDTSNRIIPESQQISARSLESQPETSNSSFTENANVVRDIRTFFDYCREFELGVNMCFPTPYLEYEAMTYSRSRVYPMSCFLAPSMAVDYPSDFPDDSINEFIDLAPQKEFDMLFECSGMKTGKTTAITRYIIQHIRRHGKMRVLFINARQSMSIYTTNLMNSEFAKYNVNVTTTIDEELGPMTIPARMESYLEYTKPSKELQAILTEEEIESRLIKSRKTFLGDIDLLCIQLDSLYRVFDSVVDTELYDLIVYDEFTFTLRHLTNSPFIKNKIKVTDLMARCFKLAKKVIVSDADLRQEHLNIFHEFIKGHTIRKLIKISINRAKYNELKYSFEKDSKVILMMILELLKEEKTGVLATNNRNYAHMVYEYIRSIRDTFSKPPKLLLITSKTVDEINRSVVLDYRTWNQYDFVIYTQKVGPTLSIVFEGNGHFNRVFGCFMGISGIADDFTQMLARVRQVIDGWVHIYASGKRFDNYVIAMKALEFQMRSKFNSIQDYGSQVDFLLPSGGFDSFIDALYSKIYMYNEFNRRKSLQNLELMIKMNILRYVKDPKEQIFDVDNRAFEEDISLTEIKERIAKNEARNIANAENISLKLAETYKRERAELDEDEEYELRRYEIKEFYKMDLTTDIDEEFVWKWGRLGKIGALKMFSILFLQPTDYFEKADQFVIDNFSGDSLIHMYLASDQKYIFDQIFEAIGFNIENASEFKLNATIAKNCDLNLLNTVLPSIILRDPLHVLQTSVDSHLKMKEFVCKIFYLAGIPYKVIIYHSDESDNDDDDNDDDSNTQRSDRRKKKKKRSRPNTVIVDMDEFCPMLLKLTRIFKDNKQIYEKIKKIHTNAVNGMSRLLK